MYWNNPVISVEWPYSVDPIKMASHQGVHCLLWDPEFAVSKVETNQTLADLCNWANQGLCNSVEQFLADPQNFYDIANLVKINMWTESIRQQGIVKPWLVQDEGHRFVAGNGDSRRKCLELLPEINTVRAFVSTRQDRRHLYPNLTEVQDFDHFVVLCDTEPQRQFLFRMTDAAAPYGIFWYEYDSERTRSITPGEDQAVQLFRNYITQHPDTVIDPKWFGQAHNWDLYKV